MRLWLCSAVSFAVMGVCGPSARAQTREACKSAISADDRVKAITSCKLSLQANSAPEQMVDLVQAFMLGQGPLAPEDLYQAIVQAKAAGRWGDLYSAMSRCHLGKRLGDEAMIDSCTNVLTERYAKFPDAQETLAHMKAPTPWTLGLAWLVFMGALLATAVHWVRRRAKFTRTATSCVAMALLLAGWSTTDAWAQQGKPVDIDLPNRFPIDDRNPSANVPTEKQRNEYPLDFGYFLQENLDRAERATKENRHGDAAKYFYAVAAAVPDAAIGFTKLCESLERAGKLKEAIIACKGALTRLGSKVSDHSRLVQLILSQPDPLPEAHVDDITASVAHLKTQADSTKDSEIKAAAFDLECDLAKRIADNALLSKCAAGLAQLNPNTARSISLQWAVAMNKNDRIAAQRMVARAQEQKMSPEVVQMMRQGTDRLVPAWRRALSDWRVLMIALVIGLSGALLAVRRRSTLRQRLA